MAKFLDLTGLVTFKTKIQEWVNTRLNSEVAIKVVKVNGQALSPDGSKAVNVDLSTYAIKTEVTNEIAQAVSGIKALMHRLYHPCRRPEKKESCIWWQTADPVRISTMSIYG